MGSEARIEVRVSHSFEAPAERVFDAWIDAGTVGEWHAPRLGPALRTDVDARVGGSFSFQQRRETEDVEDSGSYLEVERPRRLAFTWATTCSGADAPEAVDRVSIDIADEAGGACLLTLTHEIEPEFADSADATAFG